MVSFTDKLLARYVPWQFLSTVGSGVDKLGFNLKPPPLQVTSYSIKSPRWPQNYDPLKIVVASDFHVGSTHVNLGTLKKIVERINAMNPDIILMPGDFVNSEYGHDGTHISPKKIAKQLSRLQARFGAYATLGNHDIYEGAYRLVSAFKNAGIQVLHNNSLRIKNKNMSFTLVGVGDSTTETADCKQAFSQVAGNLPMVAMCHNPMSIHDMPKDIVIAVAGHTHGNQFNVPFLPQPILGCPDSGLAYGLQERNGKNIVITSGIGTSILPFRNKAPEIVELTIGSP